MLLRKEKGGGIMPCVYRCRGGIERRIESKVEIFLLSSKGGLRRNKEETANTEKKEREVTGSYRGEGWRLEPEKTKLNGVGDWRM